MKKIILSLAAGSLLFAGCSSNSQPPVSDTSATTTPVVEEKMVPPTEDASPSPESAVMESENTKAFTVVGTDFAFDVKEIKVKKGDTVKITFKNEDGFHDWKVDEFKAATKQIGAGKEDTITFVADKAGTFEYYCSVGQHRKNGMVGKLIVE